MELIPALEIGWLNGWILICLLYLISGILLWAFPEKIRPDKTEIDIVYDPTGHLQQLVKESSKKEWTIDPDDLNNRIRHFYVAISYTIGKIARGELWESRDCVEFDRQILITFEDILAKRKRENYRRVEQKLSAERLTLLEQTIPKNLTRVEIFRSLGKVLEYFDKFLSERLMKMDVFPRQYAANMKEYYNRRRSEILKKESESLT